MTDTPQATPDFCCDCGMPVVNGAYHPYGACLMFKASGSSETVEANLSAIMEYATRESERALAAAERDAARLRELLTEALHDLMHIKGVLQLPAYEKVSPDFVVLDDKHLNKYRAALAREGSAQEEGQCPD